MPLIPSLRAQDSGILQVVTNDYSLNPLTTPPNHNPKQVLFSIN